MPQGEAIKRKEKKKEVHEPVTYLAKTSQKCRVQEDCPPPESALRSGVGAGSGEAGTAHLTPSQASVWAGLGAGM